MHTDRKVRFRALAGTLAVGTLALAACDPDGLDETFDDDGSVVTPLSTTSNDRFMAVTPGPDGTSYAAGFVAEGTDQALALARFDAAGALDPSFAGDGVASVNVGVGGGAAELARSVSVQSDGKIVIAGTVEHDTTATGDAAKDTDVVVARFSADGTLDDTYGTDGVARIDMAPGKAITPSIYIGDFAWGAQALPSGRTVLWGSKLAAPAAIDSDFVFVGLTAAGALDPAFGTGGVRQIDVSGASPTPVSWEYPRNMVVQPDGKLVATGYSLGADNVTRPYVVRASANGVPDPTFSGDGIASATVLPSVAESYQVGLQGDDYILAGYGKSAGAETVDLIVYRFDQDGNWDPTFGDNGLRRIDTAGQDDRARNLVMLSAGRILVAGSAKPTATDVNGLLVLLDKNGKLEGYFDGDGLLQVDLGGPNDAFFGVTLTPDRKHAYVVGYKGGAPGGTADDAAIARLEL